MSDPREDLYGNEWSSIDQSNIPPENSGLTTRENCSFKTVIEQAINTLNEDAGVVFEPKQLRGLR